MDNSGRTQLRHEGRPDGKNFYVTLRPLFNLVTRRHQEEKRKKTSRTARHKMRPRSHSSSRATVRGRSGRQEEAAAVPITISDGPSNASSSLGLPVVLGRKNLAECWWDACPHQCGAAACSRSADDCCRDYCYPLRCKANLQRLSKQMILLLPQPNTHPADQAPQPTGTAARFHHHHHLAVEILAKHSQLIHWKYVRNDDFSGSRTAQQIVNLYSLNRALPPPDFNSGPTSSSLSQRRGRLARVKTKQYYFHPPGGGGEKGASTTTGVTGGGKPSASDGKSNGKQSCKRTVAVQSSKDSDDICDTSANERPVSKSSQVSHRARRTDRWILLVGEDPDEPWMAFELQLYHRFDDRNFKHHDNDRYGENSPHSKVSLWDTPPEEISRRKPGGKCSTSWKISHSMPKEKKRLPKRGHVRPRTSFLESDDDEPMSEETGKSVYIEHLDSCRPREKQRRSHQTSSSVTNNDRAHNRIRASGDDNEDMDFNHCRPNRPCLGDSSCSPHNSFDEEPPNYQSPQVVRVLTTAFTQGDQVGKSDNSSSKDPPKFQSPSVARALAAAFAEQEDENNDDKSSQNHHGKCHLDDSKPRALSRGHSPLVRSRMSADKGSVQTSSHSSASSTSLTRVETQLSAPSSWIDANLVLGQNESSEEQPIGQAEDCTYDDKKPPDKEGQFGDSYQSASLSPRSPDIIADLLKCVTGSATDANDGSRLVATATKSCTPNRTIEKRHQSRNTARQTSLFPKPPDQQDRIVDPRIEHRGRRTDGNDVKAFYAATRSHSYSASIHSWRPRKRLRLENDVTKAASAPPLHTPAMIEASALKHTANRKPLLVNRRLPSRLITPESAKGPHQQVREEAAGEHMNRSSTDTKSSQIQDIDDSIHSRTNKSQQELFPPTTKLTKEFTKEKATILKEGNERNSHAVEKAEPRKSRDPKDLQMMSMPGDSSSDDSAESGKASNLLEGFLTVPTQQNLSPSKDVQGQLPGSFQGSSVREEAVPWQYEPHDRWIERQACDLTRNDWQCLHARSEPGSFMHTLSKLVLAQNAQQIETISGELWLPSIVDPLHVFSVPS